MSHTLSFFQGLSDEELARWARTSSWEQDRKYANQVLREREQQRRRQAAADRKNANEMRRSINDLNNRIASLTNTNARLQQIVENQSRAMEEQQRQNVAAINQVMSEANSAIDREQRNRERDIRTVRTEINAAREEMINRVNAARRELQNQLNAQGQQIAALDNTVQGMLRTNEARIRSAQEYRDTAIEVINSTIEYNNANFHSWRRNDIRTLTTLRNNTDEDIRANDGTGAHNQARALFQAALEYRANVMADEREWQIHSAEAHRILDDTRARLEISRTIRYEGMEIDVDHWTCGDLRRIQQQLDTLQAVVDDPCSTVAELDAAVELCGTYIEQINEACAFALPAAQRSSDREQLLEEAVSHVEARFGNLRQEWQHFFNNDERLGNRVVMSSNLGDRIVLTAEPVRDKEGNFVNSFRYDVESYGANIRNRNDADAFVHDLVNAVNEVEGISITPPRCENATAPSGDATLTDRNGWSNPGSVAVENAVAQAAQGAYIPEAVPAGNTSNGFVRQSGL